MQTGDLRNIEKLLEVHDMDVQRGTVGLGAQAFSDVYYDGLMVIMYDPSIGVSDPGADTKMIWDQCLVDAPKPHREKFCRSVFGEYKPGVNKCIKLYNYCDTCCEQVIHKLEKILNFSCFRGCIRESKAVAKRIMEEKIAEKEAMDQLLGVWKPEVGEKVDYKPKELGK